ncbi:MAG: SLC13 family permease [Oscillospiraceae bacterium]
MNTAVIALSFIALIVAVLLNIKFKTNVGILCAAFAFIVGGFGLSMKANAIVAFFPVSMFFQIMVVTLFFGFVTQNGAMERLAEKAVYAARNRPALIPWVMFLLGFIMTFAGAAPQGFAAVLGVLAINIKKKTNMDYYLAVSMHTFGCVCGGFSPYGLFTNISRGLLISVGGMTPAEAAPIVNKIVITSMLLQFLLGVLFYIMGKGYRISKLDMEKPAPFDAKQKKSLILVACFVLLIIVPSLLSLAIPGVKVFTNAMNAVALSTIFAAIASMLHLGDEREIIKHSIPWNLLIMVTGAALLVSVMSAAGLTELVANFFSSSALPKAIVPVALCLFCAILSMFVDGTGVCMPAFIPIAFAISTSLNIDFGLLVAAVACGVYTGGNCPISTGGACMIMFVPEEDRNKMFYTVWLRAIPAIILAMVVIAVFSFIW